MTADPNMCPKDRIIADMVAFPEHLLDNANRLKPYHRNLQHAEIVLQMKRNRLDEDQVDDEEENVAYNVFGILAHSSETGLSYALVKKIKPIKAKTLVSALQHLMIDLQIRRERYKDLILLKGEDTPERLEEVFLELVDMEPTPVHDPENHSKELDWKDPEAKLDYTIRQPIYQAALAQLALNRLESFNVSLNNQLDRTPPNQEFNKQQPKLGLNK